MITRSKHRTVHMWTNDATELRTGVCKTDSDTSGHSAFEGSNTFWPDDWVGAACAGSSDDETEIFSDRVFDSDK
jgi:hypothetical protein